MLIKKKVPIPADLQLKSDTVFSQACRLKILLIILHINEVTHVRWLNRWSAVSVGYFGKFVPLLRANG